MGWKFGRNASSLCRAWPTWGEHIVRHIPTVYGKRDRAHAALSGLGRSAFHREPRRSREGIRWREKDRVKTETVAGTETLLWGVGRRTGKWITVIIPSTRAPAAAVPEWKGLLFYLFFLFFFFVFARLGKYNTQRRTLLFRDSLISLFHIFIHFLVL